jgi:Domain of unknown function (DUF3597)
MGMFADIWHKLAGTEPDPDAPNVPTQLPAGAPPVDVEAILTQMAAEKGNNHNWQTSVVDLLNLLGMDTGLKARHTLAEELNVHAGPDGSAVENIALHKAIMRALADNGGKVPDGLL